MPKLKTNKTASKRVKKITSTGKVMRRKTLAQHLVKRKTARTISQSGSDMLISKPEAKKIKMLLPYK